MDLSAWSRKRVAVVSSALTLATVLILTGIVVAVYAATQKAEGQVAVPDLVGLRAYDAGRELIGVGLERRKIVTGPATCTGPSGAPEPPVESSVTRQEPAAGEFVDPGSPVKVYWEHSC